MARVQLCVCVYAGLIASGWVWHRWPVLRLWGPCMLQTGRWVYPLLSVTVDPWQLLLGGCRKVKGEAMSVNEADYTSVFVGPEERQRGCEVGVTVRRWCCSAHTGNEVSSCLGSVAEGP